MSRRGWALFIVLSVIWGIPYLLIKVADTGVSVPVLVFARVLTGSLLLLPVVLRGGGLRALRPFLKWLVAFAAVEVVRGAAVLDEPITPAVVISFALILAGSLLATHTPRRRRPVRTREALA